YSDFPNVYTPYWRNWLAGRIRRGPARAVERAHRDRLMVTSESPEAVEEVLWMQFFDHLHDPSVSQVLDASIENPGFESFYRDHVRKLLLVRGRQRYLAKANYNVTRLGYLLKLFPDARFIVPVRNPVNHVASLVKQDRLFTRLAGEDPRVATQLRRSGHFEFGPGKRCINAGDAAEARRIEGLWSQGRAAEGWARYWNAVYRGIRSATERDGKVREAVALLRYEDLCGKPGPVIDHLLAHAGLPAEPFEPIRREFVAQLSEPDYYAPEFTPQELDEIENVTAETARWCGY
ncbi:MAG: sulfotransferase, partial [Wenzhouxiangellaceae bacterium]|nr:sulfotransferase [Wenzhouxiangellaceae bacterium]